MKKAFLVLAICILAVVFILYRNSDPAFVISQLSKKGQIKMGELKYKIYLFGIMPVGEASFKEVEITDYQGKKVYHLAAEAHSLKFLEKLISGVAVLDSYIDPAQSSPLFLKQRIAISGKLEIVHEISYDQKRNVMTVNGVKRQILANTQDPLSLMFNLRKANLEIMQKFEFNINTNQKNYIFQGSSQPKDLIVNKQDYKCAFLKANIKRRDKDNPYHQSNVDIVMLKADSENIPVLIKVFASGFLINIRLVEVK